MVKLDVANIKKEITPNTFDSAMSPEFQSIYSDKRQIKGQEPKLKMDSKTKPETLPKIDNENSTIELAVNNGNS
jgi:hypothetical protein